MVTDDVGRDAVQPGSSVGAGRVVSVSDTESADEHVGGDVGGVVGTDAASNEAEDVVAVAPVDLVEAIRVLQRTDDRFGVAGTRHDEDAISVNPNAPLDKQGDMKQGARGRVVARRWTRTISTLAAVGMVGVLYVGNLNSDDAGSAEDPASVPGSEHAEVIMSECMSDGRFAELALETNADGIAVIQGIDPDLSPEEAAALLRAIQDCIVTEP